MSYIYRIYNRDGVDIQYYTEWSDKRPCISIYAVSGLGQLTTTDAYELRGEMLKEFMAEWPYGLSSALLNKYNARLSDPLVARCKEIVEKYLHLCRVRAEVVNTIKSL